MTARELRDRLAELPDDTEVVFADRHPTRQIKWVWYFHASKRAYVA